MNNFSYIIGDDETHLGVIVDPGFDIEKIFNLALQMKLKIIYIINTHEHSDHISGNKDLVIKTGGKIVAHKDAKLYKDIMVEDEDIIKIGKTNIKIIHTPGHSPESICLLADNKLITGDTLFVGECGRIDLPGGSAEDLYHSFFDKIMKMEDDIEVYPGHNYGKKPFSSIGFEKKNNYVLKKRTKDEFLRFMNNP
ncbi:MBL fold metallo-hydrolase [Thermoproteota archaeon]